MSTVKATNLQHPSAAVAAMVLDSGGGVSVEGVGDLGDALAAKAALVSPEFTGSPKVNGIPLGTNTILASYAWSSPTPLTATGTPSSEPVV